MKVTTTKKEEIEIEIDPNQVIRKLHNRVLSSGEWFYESNNKFFIGYFEGAGSHSYEEQKEITEELYNYIKALEVVKNYLEKYKL